MNPTCIFAFVSFFLPPLKSETQQNRDTEKQNTENKTQKNIKSKNRKEPNKKTQQNRNTDQIGTHMFLSQTNLYILL